MGFGPQQYIAIDTETTGLDPEHACIIELAAIPLDSALRPQPGIDPYRTYIRPRSHKSISKKAIDINGHTWVYKQASEEYQGALSYDNAWKDFYGWLRQVYEKPSWIIPVGWNISFDEAFLRYLHAHPDVPRTVGGGPATPRYPWPFHYHKIDLLAICRYLDLRAGRTRRSYKLEAMAEHFFGSIADFHMHTALGDVDMSLRVLQQMEHLDAREGHPLPRPSEPTLQFPPPLKHAEQPEQPEQPEKNEKNET